MSKKKRRALLHEIEFFSGLGVVLAMVSIVTLFSYLETLSGLVAGVDTSSVNVSVTVVSAISIDNPVDLVLAPNIQETGIASGDVTWNVKTNNLAGWRLDVKADTAPALKSGANTFADYTETVPGTPEVWNVDAADSEFGFNSAGTYAEAGFVGSKYLGFDGLNDIQVAHRNAPSGGSGDDTAINFQVESGASHNQPLGTYEATITATASTL